MSEELTECDILDSIDHQLLQIKVSLNQNFESLITSIDTLTGVIEKIGKEIL